MNTIPKNEVQGVLITLEVDEQQQIFVLIHEDGTLNRMGSGTSDDTDRGLYIGITAAPPLKEVIDLVPQAAITQPPRGFLVEPVEGAKCKLTFLVQAGDKEGGIQIIYGSESDGPPMEICAAVEKALEVTEVWYQEFRKTAGKDKPSK